MPDGYGVYTEPEGGIYKGEWKEGLKHGQGSYTFPDRSVYIGEFKKDKPWNVRSYDSHGNISAKWVKGKKRNGRSTIHFT